MGFFKWISRVGGIGGTARWAIKMYRMLRIQYPDHAKVSDMDIFRLMVEARMSVLPNMQHRAFLEGWMSNSFIGLRSLITGILMAENGFEDALSFPDTFREVINEELEKSDLPQSVIDGQPKF